MDAGLCATEYPRTVLGICIADIYLKIFEDNVPNNIIYYDIYTYNIYFGVLLGYFLSRQGVAIINILCSA